MAPERPPPHTLGVRPSALLTAAALALPLPAAALVAQPQASVCSAYGPNLPNCTAAASGPTAEAMGNTISVMGLSTLERRADEEAAEAGKGVVVAESSPKKDEAKKKQSAAAAIAAVPELGAKVDTDGIAGTIVSATQGSFDALKTPAAQTGLASNAQTQSAANGASKGLQGGQGKKPSLVETVDPGRGLFDNSGRPPTIANCSPAHPCGRPD